MIVSLDHVFKYYGADCILRDVCAAINEKLAASVWSAQMVREKQPS